MRDVDDDGAAAILGRAGEAAARRLGAPTATGALPGVASTATVARQAKRRPMTSSTLASLKGLRAGDPAPADFSASASPADQPLADGSRLVRTAARRLSATTEAVRTADVARAAETLARAPQSQGPKISRRDVRELVRKEVADLTTISAPAPVVHRSDIQRQVAAAAADGVAREASPSTQAGGAAAAARDLQDFMKRIVRRMEKLDRIRSEREVG